MRISIIVLTYNNWKLLSKAIKSISEQIIHNFKIEIIIQDDCTPDFNYNAVMHDIKINDLDSVTKIEMNEVNLGTVKSFNRAIKKSTGEIIIPLAADDQFYDKNVLNDIVKEFVANPNTLIITALRVPCEGEFEYDSLPSEGDYKIFNNQQALLKKILVNGNIISGASTYYRRSIFDKIGFFDENYHLLEDFPFYLKALKEKYEIKLLKKKVIKYKLGGVSSSGSNNNYLKSDFIKAYRYSLTFNILSSFTKRRIKYNFLFNKKQKIFRSFIYIDQLILWAFKYVCSKFRVANKL